MQAAKLRPGRPPAGQTARARIIGPTEHCLGVAPNLGDEYKVTISRRVPTSTGESRDYALCVSSSGSAHGAHRRSGRLRCCSSAAPATKSPWHRRPIRPATRAPSLPPTSARRTCLEANVGGRDNIPVAPSSFRPTGRATSSRRAGDVVDARARSTRFLPRNACVDRVTTRADLNQRRSTHRSGCALAPRKDAATLPSSTAGQPRIPTAARPFARHRPDLASVEYEPFSARVGTQLSSVKQ